jgi:hypothetical protein
LSRRHSLDVFKVFDQRWDACERSDVPSGCDGVVYTSGVLSGLLVTSRNDGIDGFVLAVDPRKRFVDQPNCRDLTGTNGGGEVTDVT